MEKIGKEKKDLSVLFICSILVMISVIIYALSVIGITKKNMEQNINIEDWLIKKRAELETFYKYEKNNANIMLTEKELKEKGGVCWHYANWYKEQAKEIPVFAQVVMIRTGIDKHAFAIISDKDEYCIADQLVIQCLKLGN